MHIAPGQEQGCTTSIFSQVHLKGKRYAKTKHHTGPLTPLSCIIHLGGSHMGLWYKIVDEDDDEFETAELVVEFLDIWLQTRKLEDIDPQELAGVIDVLYDFEPVPGKWTLIEVKPKEIAKYISTYVNAKGEKKEMMQSKDKKLSQAYVRLLKKGYEPTPIMIAGIEDEVTGEEGIVLIDGRHRIHAAVEADIPIIKAYINNHGLEKMDKAVLKD